MSICAVILAGGSGTRLWPLSRAAHPKQFLSLDGEGTMLQETVKRLKNLNAEPPITICNEDHRFFVAEQLREINKLGTIILEPIGKNTAPAIALAAIQSIEDDPILLVLAADHIIKDQVAFDRAIKSAIPEAESGKLVTFGIEPNEPHTGYGYIKKGKGEGNIFAVDKFVEKPSLDLAKKYLSSKEYLWNSGMFLFRASRYLEELKKFRPDIFNSCESSMLNIEADLDFLRINKEKFALCPSESVDYAVMEKTEDAVVVKMEAGWSDIGSWSSLWEISEKDNNGNAVLSDAMLHKSKNCFIRGDDKLIAAIGLEDLVIVDTKDAIMVAHKSSVKDTKIIANKLKNSSRSEWEFHREVYRPWGKYDSIHTGERHQVKIITVKPGEKLSLQMHHHRSEHWVVVSGKAKVTNGEKTFVLSENESTYIPAGVIHSLENPGSDVLKLIEVQTGSYLGEDDIIRLEDRYGRVK